MPSTRPGTARTGAPELERPPHRPATRPRFPLQRQAGSRCRRRAWPPPGSRTRRRATRSSPRPSPRAAPRPGTTPTVPLTPSQAAALVDPTKVKKVRNSFHLDVSPANPNVTHPPIVTVDFSGLFFAGGPSASLSSVSVTIQPPQNAAPLLFNAGNTPSLATLAPGASASVTGAFKVPGPAAKGSGQTDSAYVAVLTAVEGAVLKASASSGVTGPTGTISATPPAPVTTIQHLPILSIPKSGPSTTPPRPTRTQPSRPPHV